MYANGISYFFRAVYRLFNSEIYILLLLKKNKIVYPPSEKILLGFNVLSKLCEIQIIEL